MSNLWILLSAVILLSLICSLLGTHLRLRKQSLYGDALSHAILPGIVISYMLTKNLYGTGSFVGAILTAILCAFFIEKIKDQKVIREDAALGIVFTSFFALGVLLLSQLDSNTHIDLDCILYGKLILLELEESYPLPILGQTPKALIALFIYTFLIVVNCVFFHRPLIMTAFSKNIAQSLGLNTKLYHYFFMTLLSLAIIACFEIVGVILIIGFLSIPPAFAILISRNFKQIFFYSFLFSILTGTLSYPVSYYLNINYSSTIISLQFVLLIIYILIERIFLKKAFK